MFTILGDTSNVTLINETVIGGIIDDMYTIQSVNYLSIENMLINGMTNSDRITSGASILRIQKVNGIISIKNYTAKNSSFIYGSAL